MTTTSTNKNYLSNVKQNATAYKTGLFDLKTIDATSLELQKQGNYKKALESMEQGLTIRQNLFGTSSEEYQESCRLIIEEYNYMAMLYLRKNQSIPDKQEYPQQQQFDSSNKSKTIKNNNQMNANATTNTTKAFKLLQKAQKLLKSNNNNDTNTTKNIITNPNSKAVTYNNLACYYRQQGKLRCALKYLKKSLEIESVRDVVHQGSDTHLNACAVLSQLGRHDVALQHAFCALALLEEELCKSIRNPSTGTTSGYEDTCCGYERNDYYNCSNIDHYSTNTNSTIPIRLDRIVVLTIAYHNIGVEQEFLKDTINCIQSYKKGMEIAHRYLGSDNYMSETLKSSFHKAVKSINLSSCSKKKY